MGVLSSKSVMPRTPQSCLASPCCLSHFYSLCHSHLIPILLLYTSFIQISLMSVVTFASAFILYNKQVQLPFLSVCPPPQYLHCSRVIQLLYSLQLPVFRCTCHPPFLTSSFCSIFLFLPTFTSFPFASPDQLVILCQHGQIRMMTSQYVNRHKKNC